MSRLVEQLFDESAIQAGTLRLVLHYCDLVGVLTSAISIAAPGRHVAVDLPASFTIWGDRDRLQQVFVNLIGNAFRHNDEATTVCVSLSHADGDPNVTVRVADDGDGMPLSARRSLHEGDSEPLEGQRLGLRLVRGFVRAHGGSASVVVDQGTVVTVRLPIEPETS